MWTNNGTRWQSCYVLRRGCRSHYRTHNWFGCNSTYVCCTRWAWLHKFNLKIIIVRVIAIVFNQNLFNFLNTIFINYFNNFYVWFILQITIHKVFQVTVVRKVSGVTNFYWWWCGQIIEFWLIQLFRSKNKWNWKFIKTYSK